MPRGVRRRRRARRVCFWELPRQKACCPPPDGPWRCRRDAPRATCTAAPKGRRTARVRARASPRQALRCALLFRKVCARNSLCDLSKMHLSVGAPPSATVEARERQQVLCKEWSTASKMAAFAVRVQNGTFPHTVRGGWAASTSRRQMQSRPAAWSLHPCLQVFAAAHSTHVHARTPTGHSTGARGATAPF